jgi:hypothetical protein
MQRASSRGLGMAKRGLRVKGLSTRGDKAGQMGSAEAPCISNSHDLPFDGTSEDAVHLIRQDDS